MTFSNILEHILEGKPACRENWNGKGMFVYRLIDSQIEKEVIPNMTSLSDDVKKILIKRNLPLKFSNQMCIVKPDNNINTWQPSISDISADDWKIFE